jgi:hypothetical protein
MTCAVELDDNDVVVSTPPILRRFVGQPAKALGDWLRSQGDVKFKKIADLTHTFTWGNNPKRATLKGRPCRILERGAMRSVMVEFENGQREIVSHRALRKEKL